LVVDAIALAREQEGQHAIGWTKRGDLLARYRNPLTRNDGSELVAQIRGVETADAPAPIAPFGAIQESRVAGELHIDTRERDRNIDDPDEAGDRPIAGQSHEHRPEPVLREHLAPGHVDGALDELVAAAREPADPHDRIRMKAVPHPLPPAQI